MIDPLRHEDKVARDELLKECYKHTNVFAKTFFPDDFYAPFSYLHDRIFDMIDHSDAKKIVVAAPRGFGKSTIMETLCKKSLLYQDKRFILYVSNSSSSAERFTENIKADLLTNPRTTKIFNPITVSQDFDKELLKKLDFSKKAWVANGHTFVMPRGAGQQIRGLKWIRYRPDFIVIDDLEDDIEIENEVQRDKLKKWFYGALLKTVNRYTQDYRIIYIDTVKHEDALITHLLNDPDWESEKLSLCEEREGKYVTLVPDFMPQEELDKEVEAHRRQNVMDVFAREFMSEATSKEDNPFHKYWRYYDESDPDFRERLPYLENILILDPSKTKNPKNAQSAFVVWGLDYTRQTYYMRFAAGLCLNPNEMHDYAFNLCDAYGCRTIGIETTGLEEHITYPFRNAMISQGRFYDIVELRARTGRGELGGAIGGKVGRARGLLDLYMRGQIVHNKNACADLETQELGFPRPKRWDVLDAAAYLPQMLERGMRYMSMNPHDEPSREELEKEYAKLASEPPLEGWKAI